MHLLRDSLDWWKDHLPLWAWRLWRRLIGRRNRRPGEVVIRRAGSCFVGSQEPRLVRLTTEADGRLHYVESCLGLCRDPYCQEWGNVRIVGEFEKQHPKDRGWMHHLCECQMSDPTREDLDKAVAWYVKRLDNETEMPHEAAREAAGGVASTKAGKGRLKA